MTNEPIYEPCPDCKGEGIIEKDIETEYGWRAKLVECPECEGSGKILKETEDLEKPLNLLKN